MVARGHGAVLNVSSLASFQPSPRIATYAATKAFVTSFTQAVHEEVRSSGVKVCAVCPGFTRTEFQQRSGATGEGMPDFVWQSADEVARGALDALERNRAVWMPGALNTVTGWVSATLPDVVTRKTVDVLARRFKH
jgi:short-subunit dehydrogenase